MLRRLPSGTRAVDLRRVRLIDAEWIPEKVSPWWSLKDTFPAEGLISLHLESRQLYYTSYPEYKADLDAIMENLT